MLSPYRTALRLSGASYVGPENEPALHGSLDRLCSLAEAPKPRLAVSEEKIPEAFTVGVRPRGSVIVVTLAGALQKLAGALALIPREDLRRVAPLNALLAVGVDPRVRAHPPVQERIAQLSEVGREEARSQAPRRCSRIGLSPVAPFVAVFAGTLVVFMRV